MPRPHKHILVGYFSQNYVGTRLIHIEIIVQGIRLEYVKYKSVCIPSSTCQTEQPY